nr:hypothetical protein BaRGS_009870 [Batillaria attramentaria]
MGDRSRAWRVMLDAGFVRVCPIQPHFLRRICLATGSCLARYNNSSFRIFSGHRMLKMRLRQVINTPDLANPRKTDEEAKREVETWLQRADNRTPDAVLLVIRSDRRYTREEFNVYQQLKGLLGDKLGDNLVVIFSMGDRLRCKELRVDLSVTCSELKNVLKDAGQRYLVFDDTATDTDQGMQVDMLLEVVETKKPHPFPQQMCRLLVFGDTEGMRSIVSSVCGTVPDSVGKSLHLTTSRLTRHDGLNIEVTTTPDVISTTFAAREDQHGVKRAAEIAICPGPHAILFVLKDVDKVEVKGHFPYEQVKKELGGPISKFLMFAVYSSGKTDDDVERKVRESDVLKPLLNELGSEVIVLHDKPDDGVKVMERAKTLVSQNEGEFFMSLKIREEWKTVRERLDKQPFEETADGRYKSYLSVKHEYMDLVMKSTGVANIIRSSSPKEGHFKSSYCPVL